MTQIQSYKYLLIWRKGLALSKSVYEMCEQLPKEEVFGLQSEMKRTAISISSNIAEGYGRNYMQNYIHLYVLLVGSIGARNSSNHYQRVESYWKKLLSKN